jgi:hypothetical protein
MAEHFKPETIEGLALYCAKVDLAQGSVSSLCNAMSAVDRAFDPVAFKFRVAELRRELYPRPKQYRRYTKGGDIGWGPKPTWWAVISTKAR